MNKGIKPIIILILFFTVLLSFIVNINLSSNIEKMYNNKMTELEKCLKNNINVTVDYKHYCEYLEQSKEIKVDFYTSFANLLIFDIKFLNPIAILFIIIPSLIIPSRILKNKYLLNANNRMNYNDFKRHFFKEAYKFFWILPIIALIIIVPITFYSTFDLAYSTEFGFTYWSSPIVNKPLLFIILYLLNLSIYSIIFVNLGLIVLRKNHNYIISIILTYIFYIIIELFFELIINLYILVPIFNTEFGYILNIMNLFLFSDQFGILNLFIFDIVCLAISSFCVYISYKNKEKLIIECEKNQ
ncbi:MAG: hypothetical protein GX758_01370 [Tenericutes bacterium]|nr:hypothetical protein [Mycoplasmatota bacterium]